ncbi:MAG: hypothetical protein U5N85_20275 [Arcicella sp.]|nr:hypothetical protein [Arcicella sp.]
MLKILQQPYPHSDSDKRKILLSLGTGFFIGLFLIYFQPFDIYKFNSPHKILILSGYGVITAATMLLLYFVPPKTFPNYFKEQNWTVGREILFVMLNVTLIAFFNVIYSHVVFPLAAKIFSLFSMVGYTFILGIFPSTGIVISNYIYYLKQYSKPPQPSFAGNQIKESGFSFYGRK